MKIGKHQIVAAFSRLAAGDSAYLVNQVVYVEGEPIRIVGASPGSATVVRDESPAAR